MWLTVSEDPHGRIRYHYDDLYSGRSGLFRDFSAPSLSRGCSNFPTYERYSGPSIQKQLEREEYDNVHPDSPIPHYSSRDNYYGYSCSPGTSSSSNYEEEYAPSTRLEERKTSRFHGPSLKKSYYPEPSRLYSVDMLNDRSGYFEQSKADQMRKQPLTKSASNTDFRLHFAEKSRIFPEDQMQFADIRLCSEYHSRPPVVPSPDYSPPQNRVRFLDEELRQSDYSTNTRGGSTVAIEVLGIESRRAESGRRPGDYRTRAQLQTSASEATLNQRHTVKTRRGSVQSEGLEAKRISLKQYGQIIKDRLFSSVAVREQRSVAPANAVFSMGTPDSPFSNGVTPLGAAVAVPKQEKKQSPSSFFTGKKKKDKKPRIRKEDISNPTNFQHKAHVGWNQDSGFSNNVDSEPMDESIKNIIRAAGQDPNNLSKKTIKFVYDFIERYEEKATPELPPQFSGRHQAPPPPIPLSQPISQWSAPPLPPSRNASYQGGPPSRPPPPPPGVSKFNARPLPQVPSTVSDSYRPTGVPPPPPPPPPSFTAPISSNAPPAPPPPPPMMASAGPAPPPPPPTLSNLPPPQSGRGNLLAEIQAGKQLKSVGIVEKKTSTNTDARGDVMAQIRQGAQLKHVDPTEQANRRSVSALTDMGGIAGALAKALEERRNNMQLDDSSDDDDNSDEKNEWSD